MKKQSLLFITGILVAFSSCQTESTTGYTDEQVDSIVNARVDERMMQLMASNDSSINALAAARADSIIAAMKGGKAVTTKTTTTRTTTVSGAGATTTTAPVQPVDDKTRNTNVSVEDQKSRNTDQKSVEDQKKRNTPK